MGPKVTIHYAFWDITVLIQWVDSEALTDRSENRNFVDEK